MAARRQNPVYVFDDPAEFHHRHLSGVLKEFENESREIARFNDKKIQFKAWAIAKLHENRNRSLWLFFVRPGDGIAEQAFPRDGESCEIQLWNKSGKTLRWEKSWEAERIENPAASLGIPDGEAHRMPAFKVKIPSNVPFDIVRPIEDDPDEVDPHEPSRLTKKFALGDRKAYRITMTLSMSAATKNAEVDALDTVFKNPDNSLSTRQVAAFKYLLAFKDVPFTVNMFEHFPHLRDPLNNPAMPPKVIAMLAGFNHHQAIAYRTVLSRLPCGVGVIPGGPGAGKTHWNLVLTAAIQSRELIVRDDGTSINRSAKVLYLLDINKPLDDTCNKIVRLYKSLGLKKHAVRLYSWPRDLVKKFLFLARLNRYRRQTSTSGCLAPTLDDLVWDTYAKNKTTRYRDLTRLLSMAVEGREKDVDLDLLRQRIHALYGDVLAQVDFIATTPVPASTGFGSLYKPDLVIFDESPHAREASTMIAIAKYNPIAWIFSGDHRQTRPFVSSDDYRDNPWAPQMLVSMMERADKAKAIQHSLLINHRAYAGLQQLASTTFYRGQMISGHKKEDLYPPSVCHLQRYLERFLPQGQECREPRLMAYDSGTEAIRVGTSWYNAAHIDWVMERVMELLQDAMFRQVGKTERGTILIISPYKESYMRYRKAIKGLPYSWQARLNVEGRVEARTIDTVQGGEADFVFLDMVRSVSGGFTDDPNRLNVALTRARQAEVILMHPGMRRGALFLSDVYEHCSRNSQVVEINKTKPRALARAANEEQAYQQHVAYQQQFDQERVAQGLEPRSGTQVEDNASHYEEQQQQPESIFADKFLRMASMLQGILDEKEPNLPQPSQRQSGCEGRAASEQTFVKNGSIRATCGRMEASQDQNKQPASIQRVEAQKPGSSAYSQQQQQQQQQPGQAAKVKGEASVLPSGSSWW